MSLPFTHPEVCATCGGSMVEYAFALRCLKCGEDAPAEGLARELALTCDAAERLLTSPPADPLDARIAWMNVGFWSRCLLERREAAGRR